MTRTRTVTLPSAAEAALLHARGHVEDCDCAHCIELQLDAMMGELSGNCACDDGRPWDCDAHADEDEGDA